MTTEKRAEAVTPFVDTINVVNLVRVEQDKMNAIRRVGELPLHKRIFHGTLEQVAPLSSKGKTSGFTRITYQVPSWRRMQNPESKLELF